MQMFISISPNAFRTAAAIKFKTSDFLRAINKKGGSPRWTTRERRSEWSTM